MSGHVFTSEDGGHFCLRCKADRDWLLDSGVGLSGQCPAVAVVTSTRLPVLPGYEALASVLDRALEQAQTGKGVERHSDGREPFVDQQIVQLGEWMGRSTAFAVGQACKKALESTRLDDARARRELLGAIVYLAAAVLVIDRGQTR